MIVWVTISSALKFNYALGYLDIFVRYDKIATETVKLKLKKYIFLKHIIRYLVQNGSVFHKISNVGTSLTCENFIIRKC